MQVAYRRLFRVRLRHGFYQGGRSVGDFAVAPEAATRRRLADHGLVLRQLDDGWEVYAEIEPGSDPARLRRPLAPAGLHLAFLLLPRNRLLENITDLPARAPGREVFVFDNLRLDPLGEPGRRFLGDSVAGARLGAPVRWIAGATLIHRFAAPTTAAALGITDRFGRLAAELDIAAPSPGVDEARIDLRAAGVGSGRFRLSDDQGGELDFYHAPESFGEAPLAVVELWSRTDDLAPTGVDLVPAEHRFLEGDLLVAAGDYAVAFDARATRWRYHLIKKYPTNGVSLDGLTIESEDVDFTSTAPSTDRAVFTSTQDVALHERPKALTLLHNGAELQRLPSPSARTPLAGGAAQGEHVSQLYVYV